MPSIGLPSRSWSFSVRSYSSCSLFRAKPVWATVVPAASLATTWPENRVLFATFDGSSESTASAAEPAGTVSRFVERV